jgi:hypothetical protein
MDQPRDRETERLKAAVHSARASMEHTVSELGDRVHKATDLEEQVRAHPIAALAAATIAGLIVGRQLVALFGIGGVATLGANLGASALRAAAPASNGFLITDRIINSAGAVLASAVLVPVVSGLRKIIEAATAQSAAHRLHPTDSS